MKKSLLYLLPVMAVVLLSGCNNDDSPEPATPAETACYWTKITFDPDSTGSYYRQEEVVYDNQNRIKTLYRSGSAMTSGDSRYEFSYLPGGQPDKILFYNAAGRLLQQKQYVYSASGRLTSERTVGYDIFTGMANDTTEQYFDYDAAGRIVKITQDQGNGYYQQLEYNAAGNVVKILEYGTPDPTLPPALQYYRELEYDNKKKVLSLDDIYHSTPARVSVNNITKQTLRYANGTLLDEWVKIYAYNNHGYPVDVTFYTSQGAAGTQKITYTCP